MIPVAPGRLLPLGPRLSALIFVLALLPRLIYILWVQPGTQLEAVDAQGYHLLALNLLAGHGFTLHTQPPFIPDGIRTPLYPLLLAGVYAIAGPAPTAIALLQAALDSLTALLTAAVVWRLTGHRPAALAGGLLYAFNPTAWRYSNALFAETVLAALTAALVWAVVVYGMDRRRWLVLAGALGGLSLLLKPNGLFLPVLVAASVAALPGVQPGSPRLSRSVWLRQRSWRSAVMVLAVVGLVVAPWLLRNRLVFGRWLLSHAFENNLARVSAVATLAQAQGEQVAPWTPRWEALYSGLLLTAQARYGAEFQAAPRTAREADAQHQQLAAVAEDVIQAHPVDFAVAHLAGFIRSWVPQEHRFWYGLLSGRAWESLDTPEGVLGQALDLGRREGWGAAVAFVWQARVASLPPLAFGLWLGWVAAYGLSGVLLVVGSWRLRSQWPGLLLLWGIILYTTFLPGPIAYVRFRVPVAPLLIVLMAAALPALPLRWRKPG